jgi:hypothetical protein
MTTPRSSDYFRNPSCQDKMRTHEVPVALVFGTGVRRFGDILARVEVTGSDREGLGRWSDAATGLGTAVSAEPLAGGYRMVLLSRLRSLADLLASAYEADLEVCAVVMPRTAPTE